MGRERGRERKREEEREGEGVRGRGREGGRELNSRAAGQRMHVRESLAYRDARKAPEHLRKEVLSPRGAGLGRDHPGVAIIV